MTWNRRLWGIAFNGIDGRNTLIGTLWHDHTPHPYPGEPTRALLFTTRERAREYCQAQHAKYDGRPDSCGTWRFRPVRVRETVTKI